jgi:predicted lactoylglutathione lyase
MIVSDTIFVMLLVEPFFKTFTQKEICDAKKYTEVLIALSAESRAKVDEMVNTAVAAGGTAYSKAQDHGWMYQWAFADLDGHQWEIAYMDQSALPK